MSTADVLATATPHDPDLPLAAAMIEVLLADNVQLTALVDKALNGNPSKDDRRALLRRKTQLKNKESALQSALTALAFPGREIPTPSDDIVTTLAEMSGEVEEATNKGLAASRTIVLATKFVTLAADVLLELRV